MAGDYSRKTFLPGRHYAGVLMQQGRVQLDADWNEQWEIGEHRINIETIDVIGRSGVPKKGGGFKIGLSSGGSDLLISPGRIYVEGLLIEQERSASYFSQPYYPDADTSYFTGGGVSPGSPPDSPAGSPLNSPPDSPLASGLLADGTYIAYLDAWQREINYLDDPHIHEVALGEADTATRIQNIWQVKLLRVAAGKDVAYPCTTAWPEWTALVAPSSGRLDAQTAAAGPNTNPCEIPAQSGYKGLENQLYRVEVQQGPGNGGWFKWSRDNGTVTASIVTINQYDIILSDLGKDQVLGFAVNQWVEIVDDESVLHNAPHPLVRIVSITPGLRRVTVDSPVGMYTGRANLKLRRWDQSGVTATSSGVAMSAGWTDLENGIQVRFLPGTYRAGDYWLIPARTATGMIEVPPFGSMPGIPQHPVGTLHHYCRLAWLEVSAGQVIRMVDCREIFPSLTDICASDICYDNNSSNLPDSPTVQKALDAVAAGGQLTRARLIGIGIVCGLELTVTQDFNGGIASCSISQGCGVTSDGTLVDFPATSHYTSVVDYDPLQKKYYDLFVDGSGMPAKQKTALYQLQETTSAGSVSLNQLAADDWVCLLFVEELETSAAGFDQSGCCNRAVTVALRPLLVSKAYAAANLAAGKGSSLQALFAAVPGVQMPRVNFAGPAPQSTIDLITRYATIFTGDGTATPFPQLLQDALTAAWTAYAQVFPGEYPVNPFAGISGILLDSPIDIADKLKVPRYLFAQYLYDFLSDTVQAYGEFRRSGLDQEGCCCPASNVFPRHLLLGQLAPDGAFVSAYRNSFIHSPALDGGYEHLRFLFRKLVVLQNSFLVPGTAAIRVTPSVYGQAGLTGRAIPYYLAPDPLYQVWDEEKTLQGQAGQNLSYNAGNSYNRTDDAILHPLNYDLEPYNFLRVEGHLGREYTAVQKELLSIIQTNGLPVKLVVLQTNANGTGNETVLADFMSSTPGLQHKGGVTMGGTFVLVYNSDPLSLRQGPIDIAGGERLLDRAGQSPLRQNIVVADFFLPYICCSTAQSTARFDINPRTFLFDDAHNYPFTASPAVTNAGKVQKNFQSSDIQNPANLQLMTDENNILYLHPAMAGLAQTLNTTVSYKGVSVPVKIVKPDASFTIQGNGDLLTIAAVTADDLAGYQWTVNGIANLFQNVAKPPAVSMTALRNATHAGVVTIMLTVTYTLNGVVSRAAQSKQWQI